MKRMRIMSPAKINFHLRVLGKRPDGYHELETIFQAVDLLDELILEQSANKTQLTVPGFHFLSQDNLILAAHRELEILAGESLPLSMTLQKRIPISAGLGGGSSNCAAALIGIRELFALDIDDDQLAGIGVRLGADVPFFLKGGCAIGTGVGEILTPVQLPSIDDIFLINPGIHVSTARIFRELGMKSTDPILKPILRNLQVNTMKLTDLLRNDLQPVSLRLYPEIIKVLEFMQKKGFINVLMSGSGPTVFGLPESGKRMSMTGAPDHWVKFRVNPLDRGVYID